MTNKRKKKKRRKSQTPLSDHKKVGTKLTTPLSEFGMQMVNWERDLLPEFLWIAALAEEFGIDKFYVPYNDFVDVIDGFIETDLIPFGLISDFQHIEQTRREIFLSENREIVEKLFLGPIGRVLAFYPEGPASWLVTKSFVDSGGHLDPEIEMGHLRNLIVKLLPGKTEFPARVRAVVVNRLFKHDKLFLQKDLEVTKVIGKYPIDCTEEEKFIVEATARSSFQMVTMKREDLQQCEWAKYFWRHNFNLASCKPVEMRIQGARPVTVEEGPNIEVIMLHNSECARDYLADLHNKTTPDLYDPSRDEVLFGLFARVTRLFCLIMEDPFLWARDVGGIILRCLADTSITFSYLASKGDKTDFERFVEYGEGQQKLLMLHLEDNHPGEKSLEGLTFEDMEELPISFFPEMLDIELGNWAKKDTRKLAIDAGMEKLYRLVFSPASSDVHGSWLSLKHSNLVYCTDVLHRYHRLPSFAEPPLFVNMIEVARELYEHCLYMAHSVLNYPLLKGELLKIESVQEQQDSEAGDV